MRKSSLFCQLANGTILLCAVALTACSSGKQQAQEQAPEYKIMELDTSSVTVYSEFSTVIQSKDVIEIRPRITGYIDQIAKKEGSFVKKGELIFQIADADYKQQVNAAIAGVQAATAKVANSKLDVEKLTPLVQKGIISPYELQSAKSSLEAAQANLEQAKAEYENALVNLGYTKITSPVDGLLGVIPVRVGSLVGSTNSEPLTTVSGTGDISAYFSIDEKMVLDLRNYTKDILDQDKQGGYVELLMANGEMYSQKGKLESASGIIDRNTGSIQMKVVFPNPGMQILSGSSGVLRFPQEYKGAILIPQKATYELQDKVMIYTVSDDNIVHSKSIAVEGKTDKDYVVGNVEKGTKIVAEGIDRLRDGQTITPKIQE